MSELPLIQVQPARTRPVLDPSARAASWSGARNCSRGAAMRGTWWSLRSPWAPASPPGRWRWWRSASTR